MASRVSRRHRRFSLRSLAAAAAPALLAAAVAAHPGTAEAKNPNIRFGLGGGIGDPFGPSMKLFLHPQHALQFDLGWAPMHHGDGITHVNYLFHFKPFVTHSVLDFGLYLGGGLGVAFWAPARRGCYYDPGDPPGRRCDYYDYYYNRHYYHAGRGGAAFIARAPVGLFIHWKDVPLDTVMEAGWSPYLVHWDPWHGDFSIKVRYYF